MLKFNRVLFQLSGSISCFKACGLISALSQKNIEVQTVLTPSALKFVGEATFEGLTGKAPISKVFEPGKMMDHIHLARWADLILLCPATANQVNRLANGVSDDLIGALFLANNFKKPYWIYPAMNNDMYLHPATQASLQKLKRWGCKVIEPESGSLACGEMGVGRLSNMENAFEDILDFFKIKRANSSKEIQI